jgi:hypothetical protein
MRTQLLAYLTQALTGSIKVSEELPFEQGTVPLYLKNLRRVYLAEPERQQEQLVATLDTDINQTITRVAGYLTVDAKNRNPDIDSALQVLGQALNQTTISNSFRKEFDYTTTIQDDTVTYEFEYRFYTL